MNSKIKKLIKEKLNLKNLQNFFKVGNTLSQII
jgi:hypothetical protein